MAEQVKGWICHEAGQVITGLLILVIGVGLKMLQVDEFAHELMTTGVVIITRAQGTGGSK